jgi:hypothetical protein
MIKIISKTLLPTFLLIKSLSMATAEHNFSIAYEMENYKYQEPGLMSLSGIKRGLCAQYVITRKDNPKNNTDLKSFFVLEGRYLTGNVDYDGSYQNGTPVKFYDIKDYYYEGRLVGGGSIPLSARIELAPYFGFAYRRLTNNLGDVGFAGYDRISQYIYSPLGFKTNYKAGKGWTFSLKTELDLLWSGRQTSNMGVRDIYIKNVGYKKFNFGAVKNNQNNGYGYRLYGKIQKDFKRISLFMEPFIRGWHISDSETAYYVDTTKNYQISIIEPENKTREAGIKAGIYF